MTFLGAIDALAAIFQITRQELIKWLLAVLALGIVAVTLWRTGMPLDDFINWAIMAFLLAVVLVMFQRFAKSSDDPSTKKARSWASFLAGCVVFCLVLAYAGNYLFRRSYREWYPDDRVKPRHDFSAQFLNFRGDFANNWFYRTKVAEDKTEDTQIKERDKWQQWLINGCPLGTNGDKQLVCIVSDEFGNDLNPVKFELTLHGDYKIDSAYAFLKSNLESVNRYRPQYRQVPVAREGAEGKHYITVQFPNANEKLWIVAAVSTRDGSKVPDKFSGFQFQLLPVSSK